MPTLWMRLPFRRKNLCGHCIAEVCCYGIVVSGRRTKVSTKKRRQSLRLRPGENRWRFRTPWRSTSAARILLFLTHVANTSTSEPIFPPFRYPGSDVPSALACALLQSFGGKIFHPAYIPGYLIHLQQFARRRSKRGRSQQSEACR